MKSQKATRPGMLVTVVTGSAARTGKARRSATCFIKWMLL
jgi:hypothetical protein